MHRGGPFDYVGEYRKVFFIVDRGTLHQHFFLHGHYMEMGCDTQSTLGMPLFIAKHLVSKWNFESAKRGDSRKYFTDIKEAGEEYNRQNELGEEGRLF